MFHAITGRRTAASLFALSLAAATALPLAAQAQDAAAAKPREATIIVTGEGSAEVAPDMAVVDLGVVKDAKTAREALDANNKAMAEILAALKEAGIEERDVQTSGFMINPQYQYPQSSTGENPPPVLIGFQVTNTVTLRVRDLSKLGEIVDKTVTLGANQGSGIRFVNDKPEATVSAARKKAVENAVAKAKELTEAAGVGLGRVIEISETSYRAEAMPIARTMAKDFAAAGAVPIAAGENSYSVTVNVTFALNN
ncbi:SIMPL domain-containing protein [Shinella oryzae]|uniref:SIMPL domain-containing protein n=1 Tax=Shinella oryzae TaxID=2871820 RepID=A0ABY9K2L0_9HYPH|nr:SIMPL domain-containing protein [Shinella oryzae]WLS02813.1 SIMPL domain-containing protein [Shinella oryzae]